MGGLPQGGQPVSIEYVETSLGASSGACASRLVWFGRRYAALVRAATIVPIALIALPRAAQEHLLLTGVVVGCVVVWSAWYAVALQRGGGVWLVAVDVVVVVGACASTLWTDAVATANVGWVRLLATFACVACQWHTAAATGVVAAAFVAAALAGAHAVAGGFPVSVALGVVAAAALSRTAWTLVRRAADSADRLARQVSAARREQEVARARRAQDRDFANALHDTAAATLMFVGDGQVPGDRTWLAAQARRDLTLLRRYGERAPEHADLVTLVRADVEAAPIPVALSAPPELPVPFRVARAVADATREALNNVVRHAGATRCTVDVTRDGGGLCVTVTDDGSGFDPAAVPAARRGVRECVTGRLHAVGGTAVIDSHPRGGTTVRLEWAGG